MEENKKTREGWGEAFKKAGPDTEGLVMSDVFQDEKDFDVFFDAIENPKGPNQALKDAKERYAKELEKKQGL